MRPERNIVLANLPVRLSLCLSYSRVASKRMHTSLCSFRRLSFFGRYRRYKIPSAWGVKDSLRGRKNCDFRPNLPSMSEVVGQQLNVPPVRRVIGRRAFASAGPTVWNSLPDYLRDSTVGPDQFQRELICLPVCLIHRRQCVRSFFYQAALYKFTFTYLHSIK